MRTAASNLEFEFAAKLRDQIQKLKLSIGSRLRKLNQFLGNRMKFPKYLSPLWIFFAASFCLPSFIRASLLFEQVELHPRIIKTFSLGLGYDLMNAALITLVVGLLPLSTNLFKIISILLFSALAVFSFIDYQYLLQFGSHLPFCTLEYLPHPNI